MDLDKIWVLDLASQKHHFCQVLSKSVMVGLNPLGDLVWNYPVDQGYSSDEKVCCGGVDTSIKGFIPHNMSLIYFILGSQPHDSVCDIALNVTFL